MTRETDQLVEALARDLAPVRRIPRFRTVSGGVGVVVLGIAALALALLGPRQDVRALELDAARAGALVGLLSFAIGGVLVALGASVPGRQVVSRYGIGAMALAGILWILAALASVASGAPVGPLDGAWLLFGAHCLGIASLLGLVPALLLARFVVSAFPRHPAAALGAGAAGLVAVGSAVLHLTCPLDELLHLAMAHVLGPLAVGAVLGVLLWRLRERALAQATP